MILSPTSFIACLGYGYELTPLACIQNQLGIVLPIHPCWSCESPVIIIIPQKEVCEKSAPRQAPLPLSVSNKRENLPDLSNKKVKDTKLSSRPCPPDMTPAVARRLGLI